MTSTFRINIEDVASEMTTRPVGALARTRILSFLRDYESIDIDFGNRSITPSFADECIGQLAAKLGLSGFKNRVRLSNLSDSSKPLVKHVILTRCNELRQAII
ncbi:STAS-like domain-containing protein [Rugamonas rubra]|jgi:hypothetical protein|uniref:STAS-like domain-containing protein n=1 Tax=Rugamonas rubra TaxID=758825 RepID=UPI000B833973|nr:STAS-like domain-containing protein [Rugamonas rubra]